VFLLRRSKGAFVASFRAWHDEQEMLLRERSVHSVAIAAHIFSADATNSAVWMGSKLHGCELESFYIHDPELLRDKPVQFCSAAKSGFADCQRVVDSSTKGTHNLLHKQLAGLGAPTWTNAAEVDFEEGDLSGPKNVRLFLYTSDGGPDEQKFKKLLLAMTSESLHVLVFPGACLMHCCQLWVRSGLKLVDDLLRKKLNSRLRYFALLSKISQVWRDRASDVFYEFSEQCGAAAAMAHAKSMCPRAIAGRWQSSYAVEVRLHSIGPRWFVPVFNEVLKGVTKKRADGTPAPDKPLPVADELDPNAETAAEHRARMGRWRSDVSKGINDKLFWMVNLVHTGISHTTEHFMRFIAVKYSEAELQSEGNCFCRLVSGRSESFLNEFAKPLCNPNDGIFLGLVSEPAIQMDSPHDVYRGLISDLVSLTVCLIGHHAANYHRRVHEDMVSFPNRLVLLALRHFTEPCPQRQGAGPPQRPVLQSSLRASLPS
jgi:hypothetical protein